MDKIEEQYNKNGEIHHFYILEGGRDLIEQKVFEFLDNRMNADRSDKSLFYQYDFDKFFVKDSRSISSQSQIKTPTGKKMIFVIYANSITHQAQNALLKSLEEPSERTYFFMIFPRTDNLLSTFISRSILIKGSEKRSQNILEELRKKSVGERMKFVEDLVKDIKAEKKEKTEARNLVQGLISGFEKDILADPKNLSDKKDAIETLMKIEDYLGDSGASVKILLERAILLI